MEQGDTPHSGIGNNLPHLGDNNDSGEDVVPDVVVEVENPLPEESSRTLKAEDDWENEFRWWDEFEVSNPESDDSDDPDRYDRDGSDCNMDLLGYSPLSDAAVDAVLPEEEEEEPLPTTSRKRSREAETEEEERPYKKSRRCCEFDDSSINTDNGGDGPLSDATVDAVLPEEEEEEPLPTTSRKRSREADTEEEERPYKKSRRCCEFDDSSINTDNGGDGPLSDAAVDAVLPKEEEPLPSPSTKSGGAPAQSFYKKVKRG
ncbi:unnamed protein product [Pleuronectes platessa]|uniref:Uncharacterized protein n=1 Tax=Pleuronectes platessa TaxID=8262 RepID=A0A9N7YWI1_PLEPL|nr:unnamed protein product [Pleuronectes platessa]